MDGDGQRHTLRMASGVHQGCPFSMGLFSIIIGTLADLAARHFPAAIFTAYADDIIVVCDADQAEIIYTWLALKMQGIGIELNHAKTEIWKADAASALPDTMTGLVQPSLK
eukprot:5795484-Prorocentrum_lima.AAC.1